MNEMYRVARRAIDHMHISMVHKTEYQKRKGRQSNNKKRVKSVDFLKVVLKIFFRIRNTLQLVMIMGILITFYGLVFRDYIALAFGVLLWLDGRNVWYRYINKYTKPNRPNLKTHPETNPWGKSGKIPFSKKYQKLLKK